LLTLRLIAISIALVIVLTAVGGYVAYTHGVAIPGIGAVVRSPDGRVTLEVPWGAESQGTHVDFRSDPGATATLTGARGFSPLGAPVGITVHGYLQPGRVRVTFAYDPAALPRGVTPANLGLATFDPGLDGWVAILRASVDSNRHTISAIAPHFSLFSAIFLDPAKQVITFAGRAIRTVIDGTVTVVKWTTEFFKTLVKTVLDLTGAAPQMVCSPVSDDLTAAATSLGDRLTACAQATATADTLRIRNGFAFPLLSSPLMSGVALGFDDIFGNGIDIANLLRSAFWSIQHKAIVPGANLGSVTVTAAMNGSATVDLDLDAIAVAEDIIVAFVLLYAPEESILKAGLQDMVKRLLTIGTLDAAKASTPAALILHLFDALNCAVTSSHSGLDAQPFTRDWLGQLAGIAQDCLNALLYGLHLQSALADLLGQVKVIPEVLQTWSAQVLASLPPGLRLDSTHFSVRVDRLDVRTAVAPYVDSWQGHSRLLVIKNDGTGTLSYRQYDACPIPLPTAVDMCFMIETLKFGISAKGLVATVVDSHVEAGTTQGGKGIANGTTYSLQRTAADVISFGGGSYCRGQALARGDCGA
jgi:hypothetical protein